MKQTPQFDTDIAIVGGGLNGPALALALSQAGFKVTLIDAIAAQMRAEPAFDGRAYAIALSSRRMLEALGIWGNVADQSEPILDIIVSDGRPGEGASPLYLHFDHREIEEGPFGALIEDRYLRHALLQAVEVDPAITILAPAKVTGQTITPTQAQLQIEGHGPLTARLIIGCDGRKSGTATRAGIGRMEWGYDQSSLVCAVDHELHHNGVAHQMFFPEGPLAILPLGKNRSSIVWTETTARATEIQALGDDAYLDALRPRFGDFLGDIKLAGARYTYPLGLSLAKSWHAPRVVLAGDAAHGIHPLAGQGLNLGLRDVAALAEVLTDAKRRGEDFASDIVLARYAQWRRFDTAGLAIATDGLNRLFSNDNPVLRGLRDIGLGAVNALAPARNRFMREAAGLTGDLPRLMRGRPL